MNDIVIVGGGHAGAALCAALVTANRGHRIHLVCEEPLLPYQRPPLSKAYLKEADPALQWHRGPAWFVEHNITLYQANPAITIDREARRIELADGSVLAYHWLVLATGTRARSLPQLLHPLSNVHVLRSAADALRLRSALPTMRSLDVLGGGFIGLEVAATARALGKTVRVLESAPRLMLRSVSPELADHVLTVHRESGIDVRTGITVGAFTVEGDRLTGLKAGGQQLPIDNLLLGVGAIPEHSLASAAGLACDNGITVDSHMRTTDPAILAIGDCTNFPEPGTGRRLRLESVQNANDQARTAAATILGEPIAYGALAWFWSEQGSMRLQMAGLMPPPEAADRYRRPGLTEGSFSILHYASGRLRCVESVNAPMDHMAARKLLEAGINPAAEAACDPAMPLKRLVG